MIWVAIQVLVLYSTILKALCYRVSSDRSIHQFKYFTVSYFRSEYSAFWRCVKAGAAYLVTQLCKVKTEFTGMEL